MRLVLKDGLARAQVRARAAAGIADGANILLNAARAGCPVETGTLRESGFVQAEGCAARVGFDAPYAACVHERGSKFLENAANDSGVQNEILSGIARRMVL